MTIESRQEEVEAVHQEALEEYNASQPVHADTNPEPRFTCEPTNLTDSELHSIASSAKDGEKYKRLWAGDWQAWIYPSQSEADDALFWFFAFYTGRDEARMEILFRQSGLALTLDRKSNPESYLKRTIKRVCALVTTTYQSNRKPLDDDNDKNEYRMKCSRKRAAEQKPTSDQTKMRPSVKFDIDQEVAPKFSKGKALFDLIASQPPAYFGDDPIRYLVEPEVPEGCLGFITGKASCGKSTLVLAWAKQIALNGTPVIYLDHDNPKPIALDRIKRVVGSLPPNFAYFGQWSLDESGGSLPMPQLKDELLTDMIRSQVKPLIIFDTFISFAHCDENDNYQVGLRLAEFRRFTSYGATVLVIHHSKKDGTNPCRGAGSMLTMIDFGLEITSTEGADGLIDFIYVKTFKPRIGPVKTKYRVENGVPIRMDAESLADRLCDLVRKNPGLSQDAFVDLACKRHSFKPRLKVETCVKECITAGKLIYPKKKLFVNVRETPSETDDDLENHALQEPRRRSNKDTEEGNAIRTEERIDRLGKHLCNLAA